ncbi:MAG: ORF6N domain-containing protein [Elusimicrobiaceae bacterium]|nr:ORF6N domain-containing protein [Elusimicrobiaceae bacterium]
MNFRIIRNIQVITDSDLANALDLLPKSFISFFKRNISVFPQQTYFKLTENEKQDLVKNYCVTHAERLRYAKRLPYVFTPNGVVLCIFLLKKCKKAAELRMKLLTSNNQDEIINTLSK